MGPWSKAYRKHVAHKRMPLFTHAGKLWNSCQKIQSDRTSPFIIVPLRSRNAKRKLLLYFFTNHLCSGMGCTFMKLMDDTELEKAASLLEGRTSYSSSLANSF